jgi:hypothetical protein
MMKVFAIALSSVLMFSAFASVTMAESKDRQGSNDQELLNMANKMEERARAFLVEAEKLANNEAILEIETALKLIGKAKQLIDNNDLDGARGALGEAGKHLSKAYGMLVSKDAATGDLSARARHLMEKAQSLKSVAEEHGNEKALEAIQEVMNLLEQAMKLASGGDVGQATQLLSEAGKMLRSIAGMLGHVTDKERQSGSGSPASADSLLRIAEEIANKAKRVMQLAGEQENSNALAEAEIALKLSVEATLLVEQGSLEEARKNLREASSHLNNAVSILNSTDVTEKPTRARDGARANDAVPVNDVSDIFRLKFSIEGNGYGVVKEESAVGGALVRSELLMTGVAEPAGTNGIGFVLKEVLLTLAAPDPDASDKMIKLKSIEPWQGKARAGGTHFATRGTLADENGTIYNAHVEGRLLEVSNQGLLYKIAGKLELHDQDNAEADADNLAVNLHLLAVAKKIE